MNSNNDKDFAQIFEPMRAESVSPDLRERVEHAARYYPVKTAHNSRNLRLWVATGTAAAIVGLTLFAPRAASGMIVRMANALQNIKSLHVHTFFYKNGQWVSTGNTWYAHGDYRVENTYSTDLFVGDQKFSKVAGQQTVLVSKRENGEGPAGMEGGMDMKSSLEQMRKAGFRLKVDLGPKSALNGHNVQTVTATREGHNERDIILVDLDTDLPLNMEHQILTPNGWQMQIKADCEYDGSVSESVFTPDFGPGTKVVDLDNLRQDLVKDLSREVAKVQIGDETTVIRNIQVNERGWVFLLWTGKIGGRDYRLSLTDAQGNEYARTNFNPGAKPYNDSKLPKVLVKGEIVDGAWFVPIHDIQPRQGGEYQLTVSKFVAEGPRVVNMGLWFQRPWEDSTVAGLDPKTAKLSITKVATLTIPGSDSFLNSIPDYCFLFQDAPSTMKSAESKELEARTRYWMAKASDTFKGGQLEMGMDMPEKYLLGAPVVYGFQLGRPAEMPSGQYNQAALKEIAELIKKRLAITADADMSGQGSAFDWADLAFVERALGNSAEADKDIATAERIRPEIKWR